MSSAHLYRGTTENWSGNESIQAEGRTCATTDPFVATVFAVHCRSYGRAVVYVFSATEGESRESTNSLAAIEAEMLVSMPPARFAAESRIITVENAIDHLADLGFQLPERLPLAHVTPFLRNYDRRLTAEEIELFNRSCGVIEDD